MPMDADLPKLENIAKAYSSGMYQKPAYVEVLPQKQMEEKNRIGELINKIMGFGAKEANAAEVYATETIEGLVIDAKKLLEEGKYEKAISLLEKPYNNINARGGFGDLSKRDAQIFGDMKKALAEGYFQLGGSFFNKADYANAAKKYEQAVQLDPTNCTYHNNLGTAYSGLDEDLKAHAEYRKAIELDPNSPLPHYNLSKGLFILARSYLKDGTKEPSEIKKMFLEAKDLLETYLKLDPNGEVAPNAKRGLSAIKNKFLPMFK